MAEVVIITGSSGRLGKCLIQKLQGQFTLVGLDVKAPEFKASNFTFIPVDLSKTESIQKALQQVKEKYGDKIVSVVHLAAYYSFEGGAWENYEKITIEGTKKLLQQLSSFAVEQFIFSSTLLVHKPTKPGELINELSEVDPSWAYPKSKILTETVIQEEKGNIPTVVLRIAGCYDDGCHSIPIAHMIQRIYEKDPTSYVFPGNLSHGASFIHFEDFAEAVFRVITKRKELGSEKLFLLGEAKTHSYEDLQNEIAKCLYGKKWTTFRIPKWVAKIGAWLQLLFFTKEKPFIRPWMIDLADDHFELDLANLEKSLAWRPEKDLLQTIPKMIEALKESPVLWYRENGLPYKGS